MPKLSPDYYSKGILRKKTQYMCFYEVGRKRKTKIYWVNDEPRHPEDRSVIGSISYYPQWRQYIFSPEGSCDFSRSCLLEIAKFLEEINSALRQKREPNWEAAEK